ncbi:hypothetical protein SRHO_G00098420 [Serrasalmus rhombeus]
MPQGYSESPSVFNRIVAADLGDVQIDSTLLMYVDDLLIASPTKEQCEKDSIAVLTLLAEKGHKVSKEKLQFCQEEVNYLRRSLRGNERAIMSSHIKTVQAAPKPTTVSEMLTFLGMAGYSRQWICDFALKTAPLRRLIRSTGQQNMKHKLIWDEEADKAFEEIKIDLCTAPALANPDYSKIFQLYVAVRNGYVNAVLAQEHNKQSQPIAYFNSQLDKIEQGMPPCYQGLAAASYACEKATSITMGHKVELFTNHALHTLLTSGSLVPTNARRTGYDVILSAPELTIKRCSKVNPAERLATPDEGRPMPVTYLRGPTRGPNLEQLQKELQEYVKCLTKIHKEIFTQVKGATEGRTSTIDDERLKEKDQINSHHTLQQTEKQEISLQWVRAEPQDLSQGASPEQRHLMMKTQIDVSESLGYGWFIMNRVFALVSTHGQFTMVRAELPRNPTETVRVTCHIGPITDANALN